MNLLKLPLLCTLIFSTVLTPVAGQQKRRNADKPPAKVSAPTPPPSPLPAATPAPAPPTLDTLLAADSFKVYAEIGGVGALMRSSAVNDVLEPILKLGGPPKDFVDLVTWMKAHADELTSSRMLIAAWPTFKDLPSVVVAIEFSSAEEAEKFEKPLNGILTTILPPTTPQSSPSPEQKPAPQQPAAQQKPPAPVPGYYLQRHGSLLVVSGLPVQLKKLRPAGSKPLSEDPNYRVAYNRFASDPIFVLVDINAIENEQRERQKQWAEEQKKLEEARKAEQEKLKTETKEEPEAPGDIQVKEDEKLVAVAQASPQPQTEPAKEPTQAELTSAVLSSVSYSLFASVPVLPDAVGLGFSPDNESFDVRALMIDGAGKTSDPVPVLLHWLKLGAPITPQSPTVLPNDSELVATVSVDFQQIYTRISAPRPAAMFRASGGEDVAVEPEAPLANLEKQLKIKIKDDLLPLLGSEVAVSLPLAEYNPFGPPASRAVTPSKDEEKDPKEGSNVGFAVISLRDREGMQKLLPRILEGFAGKAAAALAQTERHEDTELVSYAGMFAYAFVGNFLVLSSDPATVRHVVDSYLKGATLSADIQFRNSTRWQPHELQGQVYVSTTFMESYKRWASSPNAGISEEARAFFARLTTTSQPITYSLSNDGFGTLHELHIPKNVLLLAVAGTAATDNPPPNVANEREATATLWIIANAERRYKEKNPAYGSLEDLLEAECVAKEALNSQNYKFEVTITADGYSISAVPIEYGKSGKLSFFMDQTGVVRGADHGGNPASASDPPVGY